MEDFTPNSTPKVGLLSCASKFVNLDHFSVFLYNCACNALRNGAVCFSVSSSCSTTSNTTFQQYSVQPFKKDHLRLTSSFDQNILIIPHFLKHSYYLHVCDAAERFPKASLLVAQAQREQALTFHPFPDQEADYCTAASSQVTRLDW